MLKMMFKAPRTRGLLPPELPIPSSPLPFRQEGKSTQRLQQHKRLPPTFLPAVSKGKTLLLERYMQWYVQLSLSSHLRLQLSVLQPCSWLWGLRSASWSDCSALTKSCRCSWWQSFAPENNCGSMWFNEVTKAEHLY